MAETIEQADDNQDQETALANQKPKHWLTPERASEIGKLGGRPTRAASLAAAHKRRLEAEAKAEAAAMSFIELVESRKAVFDEVLFALLDDIQGGKVKGIALAQQANAVRGILLDATTMLGQMPKSEAKAETETIRVIVRNTPGLGMGQQEIGVEIQHVVAEGQEQGSIESDYGETGSQA